MIKPTALLNAPLFGAARHSIRHKLILVVMTTTAAALFVTAAAMAFYDLHTYQQSSINDLFTQAEILGRASESALNFDDPKTARETLELLKVRPRIVAGAIYTANGTLFANYTVDGKPDSVLPRLPAAEGYRIENNQLVIFKRIENAKETLGTIYLREHYELRERLQSYLAILSAVLLVSMVVAFIMSAWLQATLANPILAITDVARRVREKRDFSLRVKKTTEDETGYLVDTFNNMLAEVGRQTDALETSNRTLQHETEERRNAEAALRVADQRKDEFLATLAHELRNPLAPLRNALAIMRLKGRDAAAVAAARDMMERQLLQMVRLVDDLLDVSRITTGKMIIKKEPVELQSIVRNALDAVAPNIDAQRHTLKVDLPDYPVIVYGDATRLAQVFLNLLNNAAKFTHTGGRIGFSVRLEASSAVITVDDNGIGIPEDKLPAIFNMFTQLDRSLERPHAGLGVGLALARHLIELHGGTLEARSSGVGQGSEFIIRLPVMAEATQQAAQAHDTSIVPAEAAQTAIRHRILLADDNTDFAESFALILRTMGHEVRVEHDGIKALQAAADFAPDFAFLDIGLPKLNGYELARRLRQMPATSHSRLIAVTGWGQEEDKLKARDSGFDRHMVKPVEIQKIESLLFELNRESGTA